MILKLSFNVIKGMRQDISPSKANPEYVFDARNIRLTARGNDTLLSISNELGTSKCYPEEGYLIYGVALGYCIINKFLVVFSRSYTRTDKTTEYITRIYYLNNKWKSDILYTSYNRGLNFGSNILTLGIYENENILKVYWVDGVNLPRVINIVKDYLERKTVEEIANSYTDTSFNFVPSLLLNENCYIKTVLNGNGKFSAGTILYAFTYYNKYGLESNIFYTTDLLYITYSDRGGSPEDKIPISFNIQISNLDYSHFDYVRIYSIHRTSVNATPEVKRIIDLPTYSLETTQEFKDVYSTRVNKSSVIEVNGKLLSEYSDYLEEVVWDDRTGYLNGSYYKFTKAEFEDILIVIDDITITHSDNNLAIYIAKDITKFINKEVRFITADDAEDSKIRIYQKKKLENKVVFTDTNTTGEAVDPTFLLYVGGEDIIANTLEQKDNTLFLGNIVLNKPSILSSVKDKLSPVYDNTTNVWLNKISISQNTRDIIAEGQIGSCYAYTNLLIQGNSTTFKIGEHYRLGLLFLYNNGKWSEPVPIDYDYTVVPTYNSISCRPSTVIDDDKITYKLPYLYITLDKDISKSLIDSGYKKVRAVIVNPSLQDRKVILQGMVCPTVYTNYNRDSNKQGDIYALSSWFFRPFHTGINNETEYLNDNAGGYILYTHGNPVYSMYQSFGVLQESSLPNICAAEIEYAGPQTSNDYNKIFRVDLQFLNLYSPDIEFDTSIQQLDALKFTFVKVGRVEFDASVGDINILTSSPTIGEKSKGFVHKTTKFLWSSSNTNLSAKSLVSNLFYVDYVVDEIKGENRFLPLTGYGIALFLVCPWQSSGSLNNDINRPANAGTRSAVLKRKVISNLKVSFNNAWRSTTLRYTDIQIGVFNSNEVSLLKYKGNNYLGNVDTLLTYNNDYSKTARLLNDSSYEIMTVYDRYNKAGLVGDEYPDLGRYNPSIRMKYKTAPHIVFQLSTALTSDTTSKPHLYLMDICRDTVDNAFGGTSDAALKANLWIPSGLPVLLDENNDITVNFLHGDCWYQRYDCLKTYPFTSEDENSVVEIGSFMVETRVNIDGRYDRNRGLLSNLNITPLNFNLLNNVYTQQDNFFNYRMLDKDYYKLNNFPNTITWSKEKYSGEEIDTWTNITMTNTFDVDGNLGYIQSIENYNNELYVFLDKGISKILFNNRVQINPSDNIPIEISNGYKVQGKVYLSNTVGCQNQKAIKVTPNGIYFSDLNNSGLYLLSLQGIQDISTPRGFTNWVKEYLPDKIFYDTNNGDLYFIGQKVLNDYKKCLCFSEKLNEFTSFMDYGYSDFMFNIDNSFYSIYTNMVGNGSLSSLYTMFEGDYNNFFDSIKPYHISYIANLNPTDDKVFNTLEFRGDSLNINNDNLIKGIDTKMPNVCPFNKVTVWNEYQEGEIILSKVFGKPSNLKEKFRTWRVNIPRDKSNNRDRIRNPWTYIKLEGSNNTNRMQLHDLQVYYYNNSIYGYSNLR